MLHYPRKALLVVALVMLTPMCCRVDLCRHRAPGVHSHQPCLYTYDHYVTAYNIRRESSSFPLGWHHLAGLTLSQHPCFKLMVALKICFIGLSSAASTASKTWKNRVVRYCIWVSANCWPMQIRGPPLKGMYSQLERRQVSNVYSPYVRVGTLDRAH